MLVLTRRPGQAVLIGPDIRVSIERVTGLQVRIGIEAPKEIIIDREEIKKRKEYAKKEFDSTIPHQDR